MEAVGEGKEHLSFLRVRLQYVAQPIAEAEENDVDVLRGVFESVLERRSREVAHLL